MVCKNCGKELPENARFCDGCGAAQRAGPKKRKARTPVEGRKISDNITLCPDGKYRWVYEFAMLKNPVLLFTVFKVMAFSVFVTFLIVILIGLLTGNGFTGLWDLVKVFVLLGCAMELVTLISYLIVAWKKGFKYCVLFEMDEECVAHIEMPKTFKKTEVLGWITALVGVATYRPSVAGAGILAATKQSSTTEFSRVHSVKVLRRWNTIKVDLLLDKNQVYVEKEDFDFVLGFIRARVPEKVANTIKV